MAQNDEIGRHLESTIAVVPGDEPGTAGRIVVGLDGSDCSVEALRWALQEGIVRHDPVHVVMSWTMVPLLAMVPVVPPPEVDLESAARDRLAAILKDHADLIGRRPADSSVTSAVVEGGAAVALLDAAADASLLVVGSRGHGGFTGLLLGSVSQQCTAHAVCPVVVIHTSDQ